MYIHIWYDEQTQLHKYTLGSGARFIINTTITKYNCMQILYDVRLPGGVQCTFIVRQTRCVERKVKRRV